MPSQLLVSLPASIGIDFVVEALQCLKSFIHQDLIFQEVVSTMQEEHDFDLADEDPANHEANASDIVCNEEDWSWESLVDGLEDGEELCELALTI